MYSIYIHTCIHVIHSCTSCLWGCLATWYMLCIRANTHSPRVYCMSDMCFQLTHFSSQWGFSQRPRSGTILCWGPFWWVLTPQALGCMWRGVVIGKMWTHHVRLMQTGVFSRRSQDTLIIWIINPNCMMSAYDNDFFSWGMKACIHILVLILMYSHIGTHILVY